MTVQLCRRSEWSFLAPFSNDPKAPAREISCDIMGSNFPLVCLYTEFKKKTIWKKGKNTFFLLYISTPQKSSLVKNCLFA